MERTLKRTIKNGIEWVYRPGLVYTARYKGWDINIRHVPVGRQWRLFVTHGGGGSIAFKHQFYPTIEAARESGIRMVNDRSQI